MRHATVGVLQRTSPRSRSRSRSSLQKATEEVELWWWMEETAGAGGGGLEEMVAGLRILAPRPEDAGLEDCALSPGSIMEAFSRAANSFKSGGVIPRSAREDDGDGCVRDPGPTNGHAAACGGAGAKAGGLGEHDEVVVGGAGVEEEARYGGGVEEEEDEDEKPVLVEGVI